MKKQVNFNLNLRPVINKTVLLLLISLFLGSTIYAQNQLRVTGTVTDSDNVPIIGATVLVKGTFSGTVTDVDGKFSISVETADATLSISSIGYRTKEMKASATEQLKIVLEDDNLMLDEVVVVGYGSQRKANLTGAVTSVTLDDAEGRALTSVDLLLQGKIAGVNIVQNSGRPGDDMGEIRIRGISSIDNNNEPLVIIDGVQGELNDVSPNDIASMSVLKDAASAAIYGSRASAGVILIETKKEAQQGAGLKVDYNGTFSTSHATRLPEVVDSYTHVVLKNEALRNVGTPPQYTETQIENYRTLENPRYQNTNWYDVYFQQSMMQNHYVGLRTSHRNYGFSNSVSYKDQNGVLIGTGANRLSFNSSLWGFFFNRKLKLTVAANGYRDKVEELMDPTNTVMAQIASMVPTSFIHAIDTVTGGSGLYSYPGRYFAGMELGGGINRDASQLNTRASIEIEPIKNLKGRVMISNNSRNESYVRFMPEFYTAGDYYDNDDAVTRRLSSLEKRFLKRDMNTLLLSLNYKLSKGEHDMEFFAAHEKLETIFNRDDGQVRELSSNKPVFDFGDPTMLSLNSQAYEFATASYFGRINYGYADRYLLELNFRKDGSSRFAPGNKWGSFPSVSAAWRVTEESFMENVDFMDLKLRGSWGRLGNQNIWGQYYAFADQMSGQEYYAFGNTIVSGRGTTLLANRTTRWETTEQINIGLDLVLWNRLTLEAELYHKKTFDILARVTIPPSLGVSSLPYQNIGTMVNRGLEVTLGYRSPRRAGKFNYAISTNVSFLKNELTDLGVLPFVDHSANTRSVVGHPFSSYYGYKVERIYQVSDFTWQHDSDPAIPHYERNYVLKKGLPDQSSLMDKPAPGDIKLVDIDKDGQVTPDDRTLIGNPLPKMQYGFTADLSYKQFSLNIIGHGVQGSDAYMNGQIVGPFFNTTGTIRTELAKNRWTFENPSDKYQRIYTDKTRDALVTDYNIYDASFFRLKSIQLGYELPKQFTERHKIGRCRIFVNAENLLLLTSFIEGFDPERSYTYITASFHPQIATYTIGLNFNF